MYTTLLKLNLEFRLEIEFSGICKQKMLPDKQPLTSREY